MTSSFRSDLGAVLRNFSARSDRLSATLERLSSGNRLSSSQNNDSASLSLLNKVNLDSRLRGQGYQNAADAISLLQLAKEGLQEL